MNTFDSRKPVYLYDLDEHPPLRYAFLRKGIRKKATKNEDKSETLAPL